MAVAAESDKRVRLNEASIKELTGGDLLRARRLYEDEWSFTPSHTMWLQTNYLPEVSGGDRGIWRRIRVLPWTSTFTGSAEDRELPAKLEAESAGILRWLVDGVARWLEVGLSDGTVPVAVRAATEDYRESEDIVGRWASETGLALGAHRTAEAKDLIESWKEWTETEYGRARRFNDVAAWLEAHDCRKDSYRTQDGGKTRQHTVWYGVGWAASVGSEPTPEEIAP
jgi:putative DNA primase/helicase